jgi:hypothetical protein
MLPRRREPALSRRRRRRDSRSAGDATAQGAVFERLRNAERGHGIPAASDVEGGTSVSPGIDQRTLAVAVMVDAGVSYYQGRPDGYTHANPQARPSCRERSEHVTLTGCAVSSLGCL